ncbi:MAG: hypothetical protein IJA60_04445 [Clostridia bacterium]|nr:hypothetical protein [Clostridia bacterium]
MKKLTLLLLILILAFAACDNNGALIESEGETVTEQPSEPQALDIYTPDDMRGCWYGANSNGDIYLLRIFENDQFEHGEDYYIYNYVLSSYNGHEDDYVYDQILFKLVTEEEGIDVDDYIFCRFNNGEDYTRFLRGTFYTDGTFLYEPYEVSTDENGKVLDIRLFPEENIVFSRRFPAPTLKVDRDEKTVSGSWYIRENEEFVLLELYDNKSFSLYQEGEYATGIYSLSGDTLSLTVKFVDGEEYTDDDKTVSVTLNSDNDIIIGEKLMYAINGGVNAVYETTDESAFTLELCNDGSFYMTRGDNQIAGVYMEDGTGYTLYALCGGGYTDKEICFAEIIDDKTLSFYFKSEGDDNKMIFTKK